jgi:hypothetical protein
MIRIYDGLPSFIAESVKWVSDDYRTNPLSLEPGGTDVIVEYVGQLVLGYDKIKYSQEYIKVAASNLKSKGKIVSVYARIYNDEYEFKTMPFQKVWDRTYTKPLSQYLKRYEPVFYDIGKTYKYEVLLDTVTDFTLVATNEKLGERIFTKGFFNEMKNKGDLTVASDTVFYIGVNFSLEDWLGYKITDVYTVVEETKDTVKCRSSYNKQTVTWSKSDIINSGIRGELEMEGEQKPTGEIIWLGAEIKWITETVEREF